MLTPLHLQLWLGWWRAEALMPVSLQENCAILKELVSLRAQKSSLLGFHTHADYVLEMNMAKTSQTVATFLGNHSTLAMGSPHLCPTHSSWKASTMTVSGVEPAARVQLPSSIRSCPGSEGVSPGVLDGDVARSRVACGWVLSSFLGSRQGWQRVTVVPLQMSWHRS